MSEATAAIPVIAPPSSTPPPPAAPEPVAPPAEPVVDPAAAAAPGEKPKEDPNFTARFAALTKKERDLVNRENSLKERLSKAENFESLKARAQKEPTKVMEELGVSYDYLTRHILSDGKPNTDDQIEELKAEIKGVNEKLEKERADQEKKKLDDEDKYIQKALDMYKGETTAFLAENSGEFEMIVAKGAQEDVFSLIENWFFEFGEVLTPKQAAQKVEDHLFEEAQKLLKVGKLASLINPTPPKGPDAIRESSKDVREMNRPSPTLTNDVTAHAPVQSRPLTREEKLKRAAALLVYQNE